MQSQQSASAEYLHGSQGFNLTSDDVKNYLDQ